jgi:hypothetical protein
VPVPTATTSHQAQVKLGAICDGQSGTGAHSFRAFRRLLQILIPPAAPYSLFVPPPTLYSLVTESVVK